MKRNDRLMVLLDTSILLLAVEKPLDLFGEIERLVNVNHYNVILSHVYDELDHMVMTGSPKERLAARAALALARRCRLVDFEFPGDADSAIIDFSRKHRVVVVTNDLLLRRRLRRINVPVLFLRGFDHLELEGEIY